MVNTYELKLADGRTEKLTFSFRQIVIASGIMEDKEKYPLSLDDTLQEAAKIIDGGIKFSGLNKLMTLIFPFVFSAIQTTIEAEKSHRILTEQEVKDILNNIEDMTGIGYVLGYTFNSIVPKGLPADDAKPAKKKAAVKKLK